MHEKTSHYGLRVMADYSSVVFPVGVARFTGEGEWDGRRLALHGNGKMEVTGEMNIEISGAGTLVVTMKSDTSATIVALVSQNDALSMVFEDEIDGTVKIENTIRLARGSSYHERVSALVSGFFDASTTVVHEAAASSELRTKVAVADGGKAILRGKIVIGESANGSSGFERIDAILLGPRAEADVLPTLAVDTDDVTCKHAASVGHLDENALFYLASRGLNPDEAKQLLVHAFLSI